MRGGPKTKLSLLAGTAVKTFTGVCYFHKNKTAVTCFNVTTHVGLSLGNTFGRRFDSDHLHHRSAMVEPLFPQTFLKSTT